MLFEIVYRDMGGGVAFRFFIARPEALGSSSTKKSQPAKIYGYSDDEGFPCKVMPDVELFGSMTQGYCRSLAVAIYHQEGVRLHVPSTYEHPGFHGDPIRLSYVEFIGYLEDYFGRVDQLPEGAVLSMGALLEYIRKTVSSQQTVKNPSRPH